MAAATKCQTPGAEYSTQVDGRGVSVTVSFPWELELTETDANLLDINLHNAIELVLAPLFVNGMTRTIPSAQERSVEDRLEIVDGPAKWQLLLGLLDNTSENPRVVKFKVTGPSGIFTIEVNLVCLVFEDGEIWGFEGEVAGPSYMGPKSVSVGGTYSTELLDGYMKELQ